MTFVQKLDLRQTQTLVMTPQLQQAIKLLQLNNLEIGEFVAQEIQQNPLLEEGGQNDAGIAMPTEETGQHRLDALLDGGRREATDDSAAQIVAGAIAEPLIDIADTVEASDERDGSSMDSPSFSAIGHSGGAQNYEGEASDIASRLSQQRTLRDHLTEQLNMTFSDPKKRLIGAALIESVEPSGYLADREASCGMIAELLGIAEGEVEMVLAALQQFDPPGIMARNLGECLSLQLRERDRLDPAMAALCANLNLLAARRFAELQKLCGVDSDDLSDMIHEIRALDPKPGDRFEADAAHAVIPDILMRPGSSGGWIIELNTDSLPRVLVNRRYYAEISRSCHTTKEREYLSERLNAANWLVRSLDQRANTILKVATEIVEQQSEFFLHGVSHLRPLVLRNIAETIGMHESTVSRVTSNKFMSTPRGMFELKYFFSAAIARSDGEGSFAAESIRHRLKTLIDDEAADDILSDDTLVQRLQEEGIDIARRTVAKYREQLGIGSSVQRRRQKGFDLGAAR
jgi:RNA polymerase sigma-54 factor